MQRMEKSNGGQNEERKASNGGQYEEEGANVRMMGYHVKVENSNWRQYRKEVCPAEHQENAWILEYREPAWEIMCVCVRGGWAT